MYFPFKETSRLFIFFYTILFTFILIGLFILAVYFNLDKDYIGIFVINLFLSLFFRNAFIIMNKTFFKKRMDIGYPLKEDISSILFFLISAIQIYVTIYA
ncbi:MAG: hypothetical protein ACI8ZX_000178 [Planctomycetota bacterium]|jgi:hypothetical protein